MASPHGVSIAVFRRDSVHPADLFDSLSAQIGGVVSVTDDLGELNEVISRGQIQAAICFDGDSDGRLPALDGVVGCVSGRVPIIVAAPEGCQNAIIEAFRRGVSDGVVMTDAVVADIVDAIGRLQSGGKMPRVFLPSQSAGANSLSPRLLAPEELLHKLDEMLLQAKGDVGVLAIQIMEVEYFARKFGHGTIEELTREFARRLVLALQDFGYFCRRSDSTFVAILGSVKSSAALEMRISQISNEISFLAQVSDLDFRIESVTGACDPSIAEEALSAIERADAALKKAVSAQVSYHIAGPDIDGIPLRYSSVRRSRRKMDRRGGERKTIHKRGRIFLDHLNSFVECVVLDVSRSGARLRMNSTISLPEEFELMLSYQGERQRVQMRWRRQKEVGVEFIKSSPP